MIVNEVTNADAIEAVEEETRDETGKEVREATWKEARQTVFNLIAQRLTGEQLIQVLQPEHLRVVLQTTKRAR